MTHASGSAVGSITAGSRLFTGRFRQWGATALAAADALAAEVAAALPASATLLTADAEVRAPAAFPGPAGPESAAPAVTPELAADAMVTALAAGRTGIDGASTTAEVTACLRDERDEIALEVRLALLTALPEPSGLLCPGSKAWTAELGSRLTDDAEFARLIETYDGTIGLRIGGRDVHLRCYRGSVIEASARSILGADFLVSIPGAEFIELMQADHNAFMESAMMRRVSSSGSGYEYLRMTSALIRIVDIARAIAVDSGWADACADHVDASTVVGATVMPAGPAPVFEEV
ncbi:hypothetical protein GCM10022261_18990 [Brevibacterium daeguense]|uniref:Uncharacterized protein n=1 Tax=Brevibacterium daeguense TaxID=909936 RepID=A0ABP8EK90_9MICO|nr:hypothetical protein [Brevibacterium daeguense]